MQAARLVVKVHARQQLVPVHLSGRLAVGALRGSIAVLVARRRKEATLASSRSLSCSRRCCGQDPMPLLLERRCAHDVCATGLARPLPPRARRLAAAA